MDQTPKQEGLEHGAAPEESTPADGRHWSPLSTSRARWAWGLFTIFAVIYFGVAILTSAEFAELAATDVIFGLPLGFVLGIGLIIAGLIITRIYLSKVEG